jgi:hypothetical protein
MTIGKVFQTMKNKPNAKKNVSRKLEARDWIAIAAFVFGVIQFGITLHLQEKNNSLQRENAELDKFRVAISGYRGFNHEGFRELMRRLYERESSSDKKEILSILNIGEENQAQQDSRLGDCSFAKVFKSADQDDPEKRNQEYWFMAVTNRGSEPIDEVHIGFEGESRDVKITNLTFGKTVLVPVEISGLHTDLIKTRKRTAIKAWYVYQSASGKRKPVDLEIPHMAAQSTSGDFKGYWQAFPDF